MMRNDKTTAECPTCKALQDRAFLDASDQPSSVWFPRKLIEEILCDTCEFDAQLVNFYAAYNVEEDFQIKGDLAREIRRLEDLRVGSTEDFD